jgi:hypothetical protein
MSLLSSLKTDDTINDERDSVGNGGPVNSGLYPGKITLAYITKAASEALGLVLHLAAEGGREIRQTLWMTSGKDKGCRNFYEKDGEKHYLPGFLLANSVALLTVGKEIGDLATEQKVISAYSKEAKAEVPTNVDMLVDLLGQEIIAGVIKQIVDKTSKNESTGKYEPTGETREENEIDKFFRAKDRMTTAEIRGKAEEASFIDVWSDKWTGKDRNKSKGATGAKGTAGAPVKTAGASTKPKASLFG